VVKSSWQRVENDARQWLAAVSGTAAPRPLSPAALRQAFSYFDKDGSGRIRLVELEAALQTLGVAGVDVATCCDAARAGHGGIAGGAGAGEDAGPWEMDLVQFSRLYERSVVRFESTHARQLELAFAAFDLDGDGAVTHAELLEGLARVATAPLDERRVARVLADLDANGDGLISVAELDSYCRRQYRAWLEEATARVDDCVAQ